MSYDVFREAYARKYHQQPRGMQIGAWRDLVGEYGADAVVGALGQLTGKRAAAPYEAEKVLRQGGHEARPNIPVGYDTNDHTKPRLTATEAAELEAEQRACDAAISTIAGDRGLVEEFREWLKGQAKNAWMGKIYETAWNSGWRKSPTIRVMAKVFLKGRSV